MHTALGIEQRLPRNAVVTVTYNFMRGVHLFRSRDVNAPLPDTGLRPLAQFGRIVQLESSSRSTYHGLTLGFSQTLGQHVTIFSNYTLSRAIDDADGPGALPMDNYNLAIERGYSMHDVRHQFFVSALLALPFGIEATPMVNVNSGMPFNITTGLDDNNDTVVNDRPAGLARNSGRGPGYASVDLRLSKESAHAKGTSGVLSPQKSKTTRCCREKGRARVLACATMESFTARTSEGSVGLKYRLRAGQARRRFNNDVVFRLRAVRRQRRPSESDLRRPRCAA